MEPQIIAIAQPDTRNIIKRIAIELLEMGASWTGMVACWWATMLMQGGIFFTTLETKDCRFVISIFLLICFRHRLCPQATWPLTEASRSLWTSNIQQLAVSIGCISSLFFWCKFISAIPCVVLSMIRLISQDFGQTEVANMATRNFALNVFYVLALIETLLLLLALILRMLFERAKKENKEHKVGRAKEENKEHKEEEKDDENEAEHEIIEIPDQTSIGIQQQDSSNPMLNNNGKGTGHRGKGTSHTMTGKRTPMKFFVKENTSRFFQDEPNAEAEDLIASFAQSMKRLKLSRESRVSSETLMKLLMSFLISLVSFLISLGSMVSMCAVAILMRVDHMFATVIPPLVCIRFFMCCLQGARYTLGNNIQQHIRRLFYWFELVSALICVVLSMMGLVSQYYGQTEVTKMVSQRFVLTSFYCFTPAHALLSVLEIRNIRIMTMLQTFIDTITGWQTDQIKKLRQKYRRMVPTKASEHPVAFIPEQEKCKIKEKKTK